MLNIAAHLKTLWVIARKKQTTDGIGEMITQYLTVSVSFSLMSHATGGRWRSATVLTVMPHVAVSLLYPCTIQDSKCAWSCTTMVISCCNTAPIAPALPSWGLGLCAVPACGALAILRGHSGSTLHPCSQKCPISADTLQTKGRNRSLL